MKKILLAVAVLGLVAVGIWQNFTLQKADYKGIAQVNGRLNLTRLDIATLYAGRVQEILVGEGDEVQAGQVLVRLDDAQVKAQMAQIQAKQRQTQEAVQRAKSELDAVDKQLKLAKLELDNAQQLYKSKLISSTELARHQTQYSALLAKFNATQAAKSEAESGIQQAQAQQTQVQDMLDDYAIKSPIHGRIEYKIAELGTVIPAGGKVMSLLDTEDAYLNIYLPPQQTNPLRIGDEARIQIEGIDAIFPAKVQFIAADAQFTPKSVETQEERTKLMFKVKLSIDHTIATQYPGLFKGGMTALGYVKYDPQAAWPDDLAVKLPKK
ncbi:HlyD family secretion protein [Pelistega europaea]|uniref:HlyD family efflux transporter periplasmic adaptor subunit n=1 Tax=Pelistega europaea TaxID=106147 RepID=A0A7Y4LAA6_9BURK|nr:HlyD family efflux transporter periplasmic adaptor subunit [Pelistega europaea]NOL49818.1 HlyD family efflux transporter periplasmic adaptor subunit [Pelistega europaea]